MATREVCLLNEALDRIFQVTGITLTLKNEQKEAVNSLLSGRDVLATGFGKSLIFLDGLFPGVNCTRRLVLVSCVDAVVSDPGLLISEDKKVCSP